MNQRMAITAAAVIAVALIAVSCFEPGSKSCVNGDVCPAGYKCTATGDACIPNGSHCGDGIRDPDEACDDGNVRDGDGCSRDCKSNEQCGNGIVDRQVGEVCDDGNTVSNDGCSSDCKSIEGCGNGRLEQGEECDDGNLANDDNCPSTCKIAFCGDGYVNDAGHREQCDTQGESAQCNANCTWSSCGDRVLNRTAGEQCDEGPVDTRTCRHDCKLSFCGDGYINGDAGEVCDDSTIGQTQCPYGTASCQACNATCTVQVTLTGPYCGDNHVDALPGGGSEECDDSSRDASSCQYGQPTCPACSSNCTSRTLTGPYCGDGIVYNNPLDGGLLSDGGIAPLPNGSTILADGGVLLRDGGITELCDDSSRDMTECPYGTPACIECGTNCTYRILTGPYCGDHHIDSLPGGGSEACDDTSNGASECPYGTPTCNDCLSDCSGTVPHTGSYCGDNVVYNPLGGGLLPDGGPAPLPSGSTVLSDGGILLPDGGITELCDDSSRDAGACLYGTPTCVACSPSCTFRLLTGGYCGNHVKDIQADGGLEPCDDSTTGMTACPYGTPTCPACTMDCQGSQQLTGRYCGDGLTTNGEVCDDGNSLACGTCSSNCGTNQPGAAAQGTIQTIDSSNIVDGETFTLNDGVHIEVFEFDLGDGGDPSHVVVSISGGQNAVATTIKNFIVGENNTGRLTIAATASGHTVSLTNTQAGSAGNKPITETVANTNFTVSGMTGGSAFDCPAGTGCTSDTDCANGRTCQLASSGTGKTCQ